MPAVQVGSACPIRHHLTMASSTSTNPIVLITGANTGLGLAIVKALYQSTTAYTILLCGRSIQKAQDAAHQIQAGDPSGSGVVPMQVDLESDESIEKLARDVGEKYGRVDILINNAGTYIHPKLHIITFILLKLIYVPAGASFDQELLKGSISAREAWNRTWNVNVTGTHILTSTFMPLLLQSSQSPSPDPRRLIFITSGLSSLAGTESNVTHPINLSPPEGWPKSYEGMFFCPSYRSSKTGMNMMMREWVRLLRNDGDKVKVFCVSPGFLATNWNGMTPEQMKKIGALDASVGGEFIRDVVEGKRDEDAGKIIRKHDAQPF
jgi:NAD(P)-dependent dehydrogenase (short-subunit alcohol dehydrogenase family)